MRSILFQYEPMGTPLMTLQETMHAMQPTQRFKSVRMAYCVMVYASFLIS